MIRKILCVYYRNKMDKSRYTGRGMGKTFMYCYYTSCYMILAHNRANIFNYKKLAIEWAENML